jgi:hypothetical protein
MVACVKAFAEVFGLPLIKAGDDDLVLSGLVVKDDVIARH